MGPDKKKDDLSSRELNAVSGGTLEYELTCRTCRQVYASTEVETKTTGTNCWNERMMWKCPNCGNWQ